jgi:hypothetical protein
MVEGAFKLKSGSRWPRLDTIIMVEKVIEELNHRGIFPTKGELFRELPRKVMYPTYLRILEYLSTSHKITSHKEKIVWVHDPHSAIFLRGTAKQKLLRTSF